MPHRCEAGEQRADLFGRCSRMIKDQNLRSRSRNTRARARPTNRSTKEEIGLERLDANAMQM